jgi:hypothetical protein
VIYFFIEFFDLLNVQFVDVFLKVFEINQNVLGKIAAFFVTGLHLYKESKKDIVNN